jgi:hypothetical protein
MGGISENLIIIEIATLRFAAFAMTASEESILKSAPAQHPLNPRSII